MSSTPITLHSFHNIAKESNKRIAFTFYRPSIRAINKENLTFVCIPSLGDVQEEYRFLVPLLIAQGYQVVTVDHRGLGKSDVGFSSYNPHDCGSDIVSLIEDELPTLHYRNNNNNDNDINAKEKKNEEKYIIIGNSMGGAAAVWAASELPSKIKGIVLVDAFVRDHALPFGVQTLLTWLCNDFIGPSFWSSYYQTLYTIKPSPVADLNDYTKALKANLNEKGRMFATKSQLFASKQACTDRLAEISRLRIPTLVINGVKDPDFPSPNGSEKEAQWIVDAINGSKGGASSPSSSAVEPSSKAYYHMIAGAGHYPHVECAKQVFGFIEEFVKKNFAL